MRGVSLDPGNEKYNDAARRLLTPKVGYGLEAELWRVGVYVKTVERSATLESLAVFILGSFLPSSINDIFDVLLLGIAISTHRLIINKVGLNEFKDMVKEAAPEYVNSPTGVWWNMNRCPIPDGYNACQVGPRIDMVLKSLGYSGPLTITAVGDLEDIPVDVLRALSSTGILIRDIPHPSSVLLEMLDWQDVNQPPATVMLISDDLDLEAIGSGTTFSKMQWILRRQED
ncbi:unnamed protein product [Arabidopsis lyrata]|nr:unnamed protein product [Arabidopsis lyrata]